MSLPLSLQNPVAHTLAFTGAPPSLRVCSTVVPAASLLLALLGSSNPPPAPSPPPAASSPLRSTPTFTTGNDSPVSAASTTRHSPDTSSMSHGRSMSSEMSTKSPGTRSYDGTIITPPPRSTCTALLRRATSARRR